MRTPTLHANTKELKVTLPLDASFIPAKLYSIMTGNHRKWSQFIDENVSITTDVQGGNCADCGEPLRPEAIMIHLKDSFASFPTSLADKLRGKHQEGVPEQPKGSIDPFGGYDSMIASTNLCGHKFHARCLHKKYDQGTGEDNHCPQCRTELFTHKDDFALANELTRQVNEVIAGEFDGAWILSTRGLYTVNANKLASAIMIVANAVRTIHHDRVPSLTRLPNLPPYSLHGVHSRNTCAVVEGLIKAVKNVHGGSFPVRTLATNLMHSCNTASFDERYPGEGGLLRLFWLEVIIMSLRKSA